MKPMLVFLPLEEFLAILGLHKLFIPQTNRNAALHNLTLQFYFTVVSWGFREENVTRKPMRFVNFMNHEFHKKKKEIRILIFIFILNYTFVFKKKNTLNLIVLFRATLQGTRTYTNGTVYFVNHYYEFVNFIAKAPDASLFVVSQACGKYIQLIITSEYLLGWNEQIYQIYGLVTTPEGGGLVAGMFFLGFFIGLILMVIIYAIKRRERARNFSQRSVP